MNGNARKTLRLVPGEIVSVGKKHYRISETLDFQSVLAIDLETGRTAALPIRDLSPAQSECGPVNDIEDIADEDWKEANKRFAAIKPIIEDFHAGRQEIEARAKEVGVHFATLYRWLRLYRAGGTLESLIREKRGIRTGSKRISEHAEQIIRDVIDAVYLTNQRHSPQKVVQEVRRRCLDSGLADIPSRNTIRARIAEIAEHDRLRKRGYREKANNKFTPVPGRFPHAGYPMAVVEIDHTPVDVILLDDEHRMPIGRPWITLAMDVCSRMVAGYYLSFDPPSVTSVALCVAHAILPKDEWLALHGVESQWPVWGVMGTIHVDNGPEFRSEAFRNACMMYDIRVEYRPVRQPRFGGHIERLLGTFLREIHSLPGTTFSSIKEREGYDSEKQAVMTKSEFEKWFVTHICKVYHKRPHSGVGMTPERKWEIGIFGDAANHGRGMPALPANRRSLLLDFMPAFRRTVQAYGVSVDGLTYYDDVLRAWINAADMDNPRRKREFVFRRDPRDVSAIWFHDPEIKQYFRIPFADQSLPSMSAWEYRQAREKARREGMKAVNEHQILKAVAELREHVEEASAKTKKARRMSQRRKEHERKGPSALFPRNEAAVPRPLGETASADFDSDDIRPFVDIA